MFAIVQQSSPRKMQARQQFERIASYQNPPTETVNEEVLLEPPPHASKEAPRQTDTTDQRIKLRSTDFFFCITNPN